MMEGLSKASHREVRASNYSLAIHGLSLYGLAMVLVQLEVPPAVAVPAVGVLIATSVHRWLERRWAAQSLDSVD